MFAFRPCRHALCAEKPLDGGGELIRSGFTAFGDEVPGLGVGLANGRGGIGGVGLDPVDCPLWWLIRAEQDPRGLAGGAVGDELTGGRYEHRRAKNGGRDSPYRPRPGPTPDKNDPPDPRALSSQGVEAIGQGA